MAGALRKTMLYLGLAEDDRNDDDRHDGEYVEEYDELEVESSEYQAEVTPLHRAPHRAAAPAAELRRITTIHPRAYNDARAIGEAFRSGTPVIMNLSEMTDADAKRLVDFSAGLIFGLHGTIERVTSKVFLLSPEHVEVTGEEQVGRGQQRAGFFNQSDVLGLVAGLLGVVVWIFIALMLVRLVLDWVQNFARDWRPSGAALVLAEVTYTVTDPPLRAVRRVVPPLTIGSIRLDLAFIIVLFAAYVLVAVLAYAERL